MTLSQDSQLQEGSARSFLNLFTVRLSQLLGSESDVFNDPSFGYSLTLTSFPQLPLHTPKPIPPSDS